MTTEHLTVHHFFQACLTERSAEHTLALTDPSISVMGISKDTAILDRNGFQKMLEHEFAIHPEPVTFRIHNWNQQLLVPGLWNCFFIIDMAAYSKENIPTVISSLPVSITLRQQMCIRDSPAVYSGGGHRICHLHQPGTALLHQHLAAVYRTDLYQYDPAGRHRGLRHSHDDPV